MPTVLKDRNMKVNKGISLVGQWRHLEYVRYVFHMLGTFWLSDTTDHFTPLSEVISSALISVFDQWEIRL